MGQDVQQNSVMFQMEPLPENNTMTVTSIISVKELLIFIGKTASFGKETVPTSFPHSFPYALPSLKASQLKYLVDQQ